jgi:enoyl-CoA hydratase/carnithine racemase
LIKKIGAGKARAMLLAGGTMSGQQGFDAGLATHICDLGDLHCAVMDFALNLARGGKEALAISKGWLNELDGSLDDDVVLRAADLSADVIAGAEAQARLKSLYKK